jgi:hypothetical protein
MKPNTGLPSDESQNFDRLFLFANKAKVIFLASKELIKDFESTKGQLWVFSKQDIKKHLGPIEETCSIMPCPFSR